MQPNIYIDSFAVGTETITVSGFLNKKEADWSFPIRDFEKYVEDNNLRDWFMEHFNGLGGSSEHRGTMDWEEYYGDNHELEKDLLSFLVKKNIAPISTVGI